MFNKMKISLKLPLSIITMILTAAVLTAFILTDLSGEALMDSNKSKYMALEEAKSITLKNYLNSIEEDLGTLSHSHDVRLMLQDLEAGWNALGDISKTTYLQDAYIKNNKNEIGSKHLLDYAADGSTYSQSHKSYHPWMREFLEEKGYYDIFLVSKTGEVVYTVFKEADFATNLINGPWKDTDLARTFQKIKQNPNKQTKFFEDFEPYSPSNNIPAAFVGGAILDDNGQFLGALIFQMPIGRINEIMQNAVGLGETGETYLVGSDYLMRSDSRFSKESTILKTKVESVTVKNALAGKKGVEIVKDYRNIDVVSAYSPVSFLGTTWAVIAEIDLDEVMIPVYGMEKTAFIIALVIILISGAISVLFARQITNPITGMTLAMSLLARGNLETDIPARSRGDEIGEMAAAVQVFKDNAVETQRLQREKTEMEERARLQKIEDMNKLADSFEQQVLGIVASVTSSATELQNSAQSLSVIAEQTNKQAIAVSAATEEASTNVQTVASAAEELSSSILEINRQITGSLKQSQDAVSEADKTKTMVSDLQAMAQEIGAVVTLIDDIAEQTNLLALNATIEAARAGEAGKGFAVVATEVKSLAGQTSKATEEIREKVEKIQTMSNSSSSAVEIIAEMIGKIAEGSQIVAAAAEEQGAATNEISENIQQASQGTREVADNIGGVSQASSETGQMSSQVLVAASELSIQAETLKMEVDNFIRTIRQS